MCDASQVGRVFQNLIVNALKFCTDAPPEVHVSAQTVDGERIFSVADNGRGIEPEDFERIFAIFERLGSPGEVSGTGMGLAMCERIVERHRGRIWVESEPGEGSTFLFTLEPPTEKR
jgi:chemotaxis family two-component system sensor kinase Cph1